MSRDVWVNTLFWKTSNSQNHRVVEVGRDLLRLPSWSALLKAGATTADCSRPCPVRLKSLQGWRVHNLSNLLRCLTTPTVKNVLSLIKWNLQLFQLESTAFCPLTGHHWEESVCAFFTPSNVDFYILEKYPLNLLSSWLNSPAVSASPLMKDAPNP